MKEEIIIRKYKESDLIPCAEVVRACFRKYNSKEGTKKAINNYIQMYDPKKENLNNIKKNFNSSSICLVAIYKNNVIGLIRGNKNRIGNFFVDGKFHRKGIGKMLMNAFESKVKKDKSKFIKLRSSIYAVPIYERLGYKKTTNIRSMHGIKVQPMKKILK